MRRKVQKEAGGILSEEEVIVTSRQSRERDKNEKGVEMEEEWRTQDGGAGLEEKI